MNGGPVQLHVIQMYEEGCIHLKDVEKLQLEKILSKYRDVFVKSKTKLGLNKWGSIRLIQEFMPPSKTDPGAFPFTGDKLCMRNLHSILLLWVTYYGSGTSPSICMLQL